LILKYKNKISQAQFCFYKTGQKPTEDSVDFCYIVLLVLKSVFQKTKKIFQSKLKIFDRIIPLW